MVEEVALSATTEDIKPHSDTTVSSKKTPNVSKVMRKQKEGEILEVDDLRNAARGKDEGSEAIYEKLVEMGSIPSNDDISRLII
ncbi:hypothetical protein D3C85_1438120 [compost metagenome]